MRKSFILLVVLPALLCGCSMTQLRQEFIGLSISDVKNSKNRQTQNYDIGSDECMAKIRETLKGLGAIARENKRQKFIVADNFQKAFRSSIDTTQAGILVTPWESGKSQVEVASGNADLAAFVSKKISEKLKPGAAQPKEK